MTRPYWEICSEFRKDVLKITQEDLAKELDYSQENISAFENGRNANSIIFIWYIKNGLFNYYSINDLSVV